jgi:hypothetical protein
VFVLCPTAIFVQAVLVPSVVKRLIGLAIAIVKSDFEQNVYKSNPLFTSPSSINMSTSSSSQQGRPHRRRNEKASGHSQQHELKKPATEVEASPVIVDIVEFDDIYASTGIDSSFSASHPVVAAAVPPSVQCSGQSSWRSFDKKTTAPTTTTSRRRQSKKKTNTNPRETDLAAVVEMHDIYGGGEEGVDEDTSSFTVCNPSRQMARSTKKQKTQTKPCDTNPEVVEMYDIYGSSMEGNVDEDNSSFTMCNPSRQTAGGTKNPETQTIPRDTNPEVEMYAIYGGSGEEGVDEEKSSFTVCNPSRRTASSTPLSDEKDGDANL